MVDGGVDCEPSSASVVIQPVLESKADADASKLRLRAFRRRSRLSCGSGMWRRVWLRKLRGGGARRRWQNVRGKVSLYYNRKGGTCLAIEATVMLPCRLPVVRLDALRMTSAASASCREQFACEMKTKKVGLLHGQDPSTCASCWMRCCRTNCQYFYRSPSTDAIISEAKLRK